MKQIISTCLLILCASCTTQPQDPVFIIKQGTNIGNCSTLNECVSTISNRIQNNFVRPAPIAAPDNIPILNFRLNEDGELIIIKVLKTSGESAFDQAAMDAVTKAAPFPEIKSLELNERKKLLDISLRVNF